MLVSELNDQITSILLIGHCLILAQKFDVIGYQY
jgi:hypothetical protein